MAKKPTKTTKKAYHPGGNVPPRRTRGTAANQQQMQAVRERQAINSRNRSTGITMRDIATNRPVGRTRNARAVSLQEIQARMRQQKRTRNARAVSPQEMKEAQMRQEVMMRQQGRTPRRPGQTTQKRLTPKQLQLKRLQGQKYLQAQKARRTPRRPDQPTPTPRPPRRGGMTLRPEMPKRPPRRPITGITPRPGPNPRPGRPTSTPPKRPVSTRRRSTNPSRTMTRAEAKKSIQQFSQNRLR